MGTTEARTPADIASARKTANKTAGVKTVHVKSANKGTAEHEAAVSKAAKAKITGNSKAKTKTAEGKTTEPNIPVSEKMFSDARHDGKIDAEDPVLTLLANGVAKNSWMDAQLRLACAIEITDMFTGFGIPPHMHGFDYLRCAILCAVEDPSLLKSITSALYPLVATMCSSKATRVERAMRHVLEKVWENNDLPILKQYFNSVHIRERGKPTNGEFIATIADRVRLKHGIMRR